MENKKGPESAEKAQSEYNDHQGAQEAPKEPKEAHNQKKQSSESATAQDEAKAVEQKITAKKDSEAEKQQDLMEQLLRSRADYDNLRKRSAKEAQEARALGRCDIVKELLPFFDSFEAAAKHEQCVMPLRAQLLDLLLKAGVAMVVPENQKADPLLHETLAIVPSEDPLQDGMVAEVIRVGYKVGNKIIRYPGVAVFKHEKKNPKPELEENNAKDKNKDKKTEVDLDENNRN